MHCANVCMLCHLLFILPCCLSEGPKTSQHNTAAARYTPSNPTHIPLAVLCLFSPLMPLLVLFTDSSSFTHARRLRIFSPLLLLHLFFNPCLFPYTFASAFSWGCLSHMASLLCLTLHPITVLSVQ